jgi:hypothetical protein
MMLSYFLSIIFLLGVAYTRTFFYCPVSIFQLYQLDFMPGFLHTLGFLQEVVCQLGFYNPFSSYVSIISSMYRGRDAHMQSFIFSFLFKQG